MRRLAWWTLGFGLLSMVFSIFHRFLPGWGADGDPYFWMDLLVAMTSFASVLFVAGAILLAATVIADAIRNASTLRESP